jgi:GT2 family glycosyltransferase
MFRAGAVSAVGLFDQRFHTYCEDLDVCSRLQSNGWSIGVVLACEVEQSVGRSRRPGVYPFLTTRNELYCRRQSLGRAGVRAGLRFRLRLALSAAKRAVICRGADPSQRYQDWSTAAGTLSGIAAFGAQRWGAPPSWLPRRGDLRAS